VATLIAVKLADFTDPSPWLDASFLGLVASAVAFGLVFLVRRPGHRETRTG
jgi:hypothetical protein